MESKSIIVVYFGLNYFIWKKIDIEEGRNHISLNDLKDTHSHAERHR